MRGWLKRLWKNIIYAVEKAFVEGVYTPSKILEMTISVRFAIPTELAKQIQRKLKN
jgi:hypothetical protein